jgi:hypothetical protein
MAEGRRVRRRQRGLATAQSLPTKVQLCWRDRGPDGIVQG